MNSPNLKLIKSQLNPLKNKYEVVIFGSTVQGDNRPTSDIDIAVISRTNDIKKNIQLQKDLLKYASSKIDIRVFELLPIYIQISIVDNYIVVFGNILDISEYFYKIRKKWDDCKYRIFMNQFANYQERLSLLKRYSNFKRMDNNK
ncbi:MAG: nucleotidyltransferase family protein [Candidatus Helarchaeota archaeon]